MRISDWSSDVCSSDLGDLHVRRLGVVRVVAGEDEQRVVGVARSGEPAVEAPELRVQVVDRVERMVAAVAVLLAVFADVHERVRADVVQADERSEEHTSELQSLMRISYAAVCLKKKTSN